MSEIVKVKAADGHELDLYVARPAGEPIAGLVVIQEVFGVNRHIRSVADSYAKDGFLAVAPALFDRVERASNLPTKAPMRRKAWPSCRRSTVDGAGGCRRGSPYVGKKPAKNRA